MEGRDFSYELMLEAGDIQKLLTAKGTSTENLVFSVKDGELVIEKTSQSSAP